jgi:hypothetical protein
VNIGFHTPDPQPWNLDVWEEHQRLKWRAEIARQVEQDRAAISLFPTQRFPRLFADDRRVSSYPTQRALDRMEKEERARKKEQTPAQKRMQEEGQRWDRMMQRRHLEEEKKRFGPATARRSSGGPQPEKPREPFVQVLRPTNTPSPRKATAAPVALNRLGGEEVRTSPGGAKKRTMSDLEEEEWRWRGDYPEAQQYQPRQTKRRKHSPQSFVLTAARWVAGGAFAVGRLLGVV